MESGKSTGVLKKSLKLLLKKSMNPVDTDNLITF